MVGHHLATCICKASCAAAASSCAAPSTFFTRSSNADLWRSLRLAERMRRSCCR